MEKIIRILSISDRWMTKKELAKQIGSSESTFIRYMEEIKIRWGADITLKTSQKLGYRIENLSVPAYLNIMMEMTRGSTNSQLLNEIIINPGQTIEYYCESISISRSSFTRKLKQCNKILESYLLKVIVDQGFKLISAKSELQLRIFVTFFFLNFYGRRTLPFQMEKQQIKELMRKNHCQLNLFHEGSTYEQSFFIMYFVVHLMRENQGATLKKGTISEGSLLRNVDKTDYLFLKKYLRRLKYSGYIRVVDYFVKSMFYEFSAEEKAEMSKRIRRNLKFCSFFQPECKKKNEDFFVRLLMQVYFFSLIFPFDTTSLTIRATYLAEQMRDKHIRLYAHFRAEIQFFSTLLNANLTHHFSSYIFWVMIGNPEINYSISDKKILIVSDLGTHHSQYIQAYIKDVLSVHRVQSVTTAITEEQLPDFNLKEYDLIVTNQLIHEPDVPYLLIDDSVSLTNEDELLQLLDL
ncbi:MULTISPECIES: helix-turn-helix domain-containing protein [unclassified Enterococcus]|uniref:helix-turn-helix domain-containing protein n=1 Tax=unclassified Enterococcus TaxID=2608891 RepID=UPI0013EC91D0